MSAAQLLYRQTLGKQNMLQSLKQIRYAVAVAATLVSLAFAMPASAIGLLILEGSDAQTFHGLNPYSTDFPEWLSGVLNSTNTAGPGG
jgi:hypothetical protein